MALFHSQTRRHMINVYTYIQEAEFIKLMILTGYCELLFNVCLTRINRFDYSVDMYA